MFAVIAGVRELTEAQPVINTVLYRQTTVCIGLENGANRLVMNYAALTLGRGVMSCR